MRAIQGIGTSGLRYNASVLSVGTTSYPLIGGALASLAWYYPFYIFFAVIPIGLIVLLYLENPEPKIRPEMRGYLKNTLNSVMNLKAAGVFGAGVLTFILLYGAYLTYFPFLVDESFTKDPTIIGALIAVMSVTTAVVASQAGRISQRSSLVRVRGSTYQR